MAAQGPQTGALTARARNPGVTPGFTSAHGKPSIPMMPGTGQTAAGPHSSRIIRKPRPSWQWLLLGGVMALTLGILMLPRFFPILPDAAVWAEMQPVSTQTGGLVETVPVRVGDAVTSGQTLARINGTDLASPINGTVTRLLVAPGARVAVSELIAEVAKPDSRRVVVALPPSQQPTIGEPVRIELLGERRIIDGSVELVLNPGAPGPWPGGGAAPRRAVLLPAPSTIPLGLGQGARVTIIGASTGRRLMYAIRDLLPW